VLVLHKELEWLPHLGRERFPMLQRWCSGECASASTNRCSSSLTSSTSRPSPLHHTRSRRLVAVRSSSSDDVPPEKQAILDRINKAKAYKQGAAAPARSPPPGAPPPPTPKQPDWGAMTAYLGGSPSAADAGTQQGSTPPTLPIDAQQQQQLTEEQRRAEAERQRRFAEANKAGSKESLPPDENLVGVLQSANFGPGRGSAYQPAESLRGALQESTLLEGIDTSNMKMSEITELKEARRRALGAELIVADEAYRPTSKSDKGRIGSPQPSDSEVIQGNQQRQSRSEDSQGSNSEQPLYEPKVSTWGLFPRPSNISSAYGGGRTIKPGDPIEDPEAAAKRIQANNEALARYKRKMGLEVDERVEAEADALYRQGMECFNKGNLEAALRKFDEAASKVQVRTRVGGYVTLQRALVLDSLGNRDEAQKLYKQVRGHAVTEVARRAKQMMFGFEAATFLKADQFNYGVRKGDYDPYFRRIIDKNKVYVPTPEEREADKRSELVAAVTAVLVITFPFGLAAALARSAGAL